MNRRVRQPLVQLSRDKKEYRQKCQPTAGLEPTILWFEAIRVAITPRGLWIPKCWQKLFHLVALTGCIHSLIMITIIKVMWTLYPRVAIKDVTCVLDQMCNRELEDTT